jgi:hypothetical protein
MRQMAFIQTLNKSIDVSDVEYDRRLVTAYKLELAGRFEKVSGYRLKYAICYSNDQPKEFPWDTLHRMAGEAK